MNATINTQKQVYYLQLTDKVEVITFDECISRRDALATKLYGKNPCIGAWGSGEALKELRSLIKN